MSFVLFFFNDTATTEIYTLSLHDALPISQRPLARYERHGRRRRLPADDHRARGPDWRGSAHPHDVGPSQDTVPVGDDARVAAHHARLIQLPARHHDHALVPGARSHERLLRDHGDAAPRAA